MEKQRIAVIGAGIAGLASAHFLARQHDVVLFEANAYPGGHSNTVDVTLEGVQAGVDTGFLVFNDRTYPNLIALFAELGVNTYASDMSFGVSLDAGRFEWAGTNLDTVFAQRWRALSPRYIGMLRDILAFNAAAEANLAEAERTQMTLGALLSEKGHGALFRDAYLLPMAAAIWSSSPRDILDFPASTFLRFCINHALLQVNNRPQWRTVSGGSREYVRKIIGGLKDVRLSTPVQRVRRDGRQVRVETRQAAEYFDQVVLACHAPDTLAMLANPSDEEVRILGAIRYQPNKAYLHTDLALMPKRRKVWSAWNYLGGNPEQQDNPVCVSYWLNKLQNLPFATPLMVTLNPVIPPAADTIQAEFDYDHPVFDLPAIHAQQQLALIQGRDRLWFAGAWAGYGFHEDGLKSGLQIAKRFGVAPAWYQPHGGQHG